MAPAFTGWMGDPKVKTTHLKEVRKEGDPRTDRVPRNTNRQILYSITEGRLEIRSGGGFRRPLLSICRAGYQEN